VKFTVPPSKVKNFEVLKKENMEDFQKWQKLLLSVKCGKMCSFLPKVVYVRNYESV